MDQQIANHSLDNQWFKSKVCNIYPWIWQIVSRIFAARGNVAIFQSIKRDHSLEGAEIPRPAACSRSSCAILHAATA